jgi:NF-kappa-B inhibitor alpha
MYAPLHIAVMRNYPDIVRRLVVAGASLEVQDNKGNTPLHLAARRGHVECAEALLKPVSIQEIVQLTGQSAMSSTGTSLSGPFPRHSSNILDLPNYNGECCVHLASMGGHVNFLQFLSWNNANMNAQEGRAGRTALHFAVGSQNLHVIKCLLEPRPQGCGVNPNLLDWYGRTPYQLSIINCLNEVTHYMASCVGIDLQDFESENSDFEAAILLNSNA